MTNGQFVEKGDLLFTLDDREITLPREDATLLPEELRHFMQPADFVHCATTDRRHPERYRQRRCRALLFFDHSFHGLWSRWNGTEWTP